MVGNRSAKPWMMAVALLATGCASDAADDVEREPSSVDGEESGQDFEEAAAIEDWFPWLRRDGGFPWPPRRDAGTGPVDAGTGPVDSGTGPVTDAGQPQTCSGRPSLRAGDTTVRINVGGQQRQYILHVPPGYNGSKSVPLLVDLHPLFMDGPYQRNNSGYAAIADREGFLVAYPSGTAQGAIGSAWNIGPCCTSSNDEAFIRALVDKVKGDACVDDSRVYAAGYSMGGGMSHYLACNASDVFAAVSPAAFDLLVENEMPCQPDRPISVITFRGTADNIVPYGGGPSTPPNGFGGGKRINFEGAEKTFARWARINGCTGQPVAADKAGCRTYPQCRGGVEVTLCTAQGGGHVTGDATYGWSRLKQHTKP